MENENRIPVHVSIIMDGNGRWAREQGHERIFGHKKGVETVRVVAEAAAEAGVKYLSLYAFSEENWGRPKEEVDFLMHLMMDSIASEVEMLMKNGVRFRVLGNLARLPEALQQGIAALEEKTRENTALDLILFVSYSGKWDIFQAAKKFAAEHSGEDIDKITDMSAFSKYLVTDGIPDPDLIIRTSGEERISNYLLWQGAYSELLFVKKMWPEFGKEDFTAALAEFASRDRRYGKVK
ncbi:MAG: polyprenyl diphosphate synthase [Candidatus Cryptobacteroides sp.]|jgi:undecaprenyl diphosphate synthase|uniref:polyprenyl diphosphate synthase n=1 Tax=Candidatus Cryptobacteroides bacterium TaxID=3085639 RepID=UPI0003358658|nr:polyprenyl diphosphate synthase [Bacteroides sp.]MCI7547932.1 polyprenyl diphosphate synthase [Bacteroides sp.]MDY5302186.1 polyprenyl diphosphate synthase [Candidatus Cryptobacteroides sp.]MDY5408307.1 polyprenyl diphosphate synthase [Candidatus Cryptobacteroides sp.]CDA96422.1 isoprenyl transferase [Bacteroides sp. CAG:709]